ncbi:MAG: hypothetical protein WC384_15160 [Prolixibacteraceae bacterium]|jgi:hypothetical protein
MKWFLLVATIVFAGLTVSAQHKKVNSVKSPKVEGIPSSVKIISSKKLAISQIADTTITIRLTGRKLTYFKQNHIDIAKTASGLMENYEETKPAETASEVITNPKITGQRILEDGSFETSFEDGSKKIQYKGGYTMIYPDGRQMRASYMSVSPFIPPMPPGDEDLTKYLKNVSDALLSLLSESLNNDSISISNFKKGDTNLNIYLMINRRIEFINYINQQK